ncbi:MAG: hypothetical protein AB7F43_13975 [Bacteriovoracia bacterium]
MSNNVLSSTNILDLTAPQTLFELAIETEELLGPEGQKLIADLKERAFEAEYTHLYYRDPFRPGIVWLCVLGSSADELPLRGKLDTCHKTTEAVFPGFLARVESVDEDDIDGQIPPISGNVNALDLATALEYIVFIYPEMIRAWAALIFTYSEILGSYEGAQRVRAECSMVCTNAPVVLHLLGDSTTVSEA